jgi:predicted nuclease of predicted toxin-antitoxin system
MRGVDVLTAQEDGRTGTPDPELLDRAEQLDRVLVSRDHDFLTEARRRQVAGLPFSGVIFAHQL